MSTLAIDTAFEAVAVVFLIATMVYSFRLAGLTRNAKILALANPQAVFRSFIVAFVLLLLSQLLPMVSSLFVSVPYADELSHVLIIATAFAGVVGMYFALYYYRTASRKGAPEAEEIPA
ncbi:MAG: hypothetical protein ACRECH_06415 [Nitrososphaerales archaeon]